MGPGVGSVSAACCDKLALPTPEPAGAQCLSLNLPLAWLDVPVFTVPLVL